MKCDRCNKDAVFQASMFLNGQSVQINLCEDHYEEMMGEVSDNFKLLSQGLGDPEQIQNLYESLLDALGDKDANINNMNILGGFTPDDKFMKYLEGTYKAMKNNFSFKGNSHMEKDDEKEDEITNSLYYKSKLREIRSLRSSLQFLVENEMYEEAIGIRDELKKLNEELLSYRKDKEEESET